VSTARWRFTNRSIIALTACRRPRARVSTPRTTRQCRVSVDSSCISLRRRTAAGAAVLYLLRSGLITRWSSSARYLPAPVASARSLFVRATSSGRCRSFCALTVRRSFEHRRTLSRLYRFRKVVATCASTNAIVVTRRTVLPHVRSSSACPVHRSNPYSLPSVLPRTACRTTNRRRPPFTFSGRSRGKPGIFSRLKTTITLRYYTTILVVER